MNTERMSPIYVSPSSNWNIVVFGGGNVALRKCKHFEGFNITVIAKNVIPGIKEVATKIIETEFNVENCSPYMEKADLVIVATDNKELNTSIKAVANDKGLLVNSAHGGGSVLIPSTLRRANYSVAVSSEGKVPAFPPYVIENLDKFLSEEYDLMLDLLIELRKIIINKIPTQVARAEYLATILHDENILKLLKSGKEKEALEHAIKIGGLTC